MYNLLQLFVNCKLLGKMILLSFQHISLTCIYQLIVFKDAFKYMKPASKSRVYLVLYKEMFHTEHFIALMYCSWLINCRMWRSQWQLPPVLVMRPPAHLPLSRAAERSSCVNILFGCDELFPYKTILWQLEWSKKGGNLFYSQGLSRKLCTAQRPVRCYTTWGSHHWKGCKISDAVLPVQC